MKKIFAALVLLFGFTHEALAFSPQQAIDLAYRYAVGKGYEISIDHPDNSITEDRRNRQLIVHFVSNMTDDCIVSVRVSLSSRRAVSARYHCAE